MHTAESVEAIATLALASTPKTQIGNVPGALVPDKYRLIEFPDRAPQPARIKCKAVLHTTASFIHYYNRFSSDPSALFFNRDKGHFTAIFDYHQSDGTPAWCDHQAEYTCPKSDPWKTWTAQSGKWMAQEEFAEFIERNLPDIVEPAGAAMLEIVTSLQAKSSAAFKRAIRLDNGQVQFQYHEEITGSAGNDGQMTIPTSFQLGLQVLQGGTYYNVEALFRYRINNAKLVLSYELPRQSRIAESALDEVYQQVAEEMNQGTLFQGAP